MAAYLSFSWSASLWWETIISDQSTDPHYLEEKFLSAHPGSHKLCPSYSRNMHTALCHITKGGGWVVATVLRYIIDQTVLQYTYHPSVPLKFASLQQTSQFQNSCVKIRQILPVQLLSMWGLRVLVLPTLPSSQNLLHDLILS